jgi:hypothetical protein
MSRDVRISTLPRIRRRICPQDLVTMLAESRSKVNRAPKENWETEERPLTYRWQAIEHQIATRVLTFNFKFLVRRSPPLF